jgi:hypothetical protein
MQPGGAVLALAAACAAALGGCVADPAADPPTTPAPAPTISASASASPSGSPSATPPPDVDGERSGIVSEAQAIFDAVAVKGRAPKTGYDREGQFGSAWIDVDANGCDTRNDVLQRDLTNIQMRDDCIVASGLLEDPFSGQTISFVRGPDSADVQIDHVVALSNAWQTGAQQLTYQERVAFANDQLGLLAVDGRLNQQKGDGDAATWLPPNRSFWCEYVSIQALVKERWGLWFTPPEHATIERILAGC